MIGGQRHRFLAARDDGFAMGEMLVAAVLAMLVCGAALSFLSIQVSLAQTQPDMADVQQRARITADILSTELSTAGAWADGRARGLACCLPVLQPRRIGIRLADSPGEARPDVLTVVRTQTGAVPGSLREPLSSVLALETGSGCVESPPVCGLKEDDAVLMFEATGRHDFFLLGPPGVDSAPVRLRQATPAGVYAPGAMAVGVETLTYYLDAATRQVRQYDGYLSDVPIADDVVALQFEYWGSAGVPARGRAEAGTATCWFDEAGQARFGRAETVPGAPDVKLELEEFRDGPWCGAGEHRFDADLLRVRRVRATVRVAVSTDWARGAGPDFLVPGRATSAWRLVPDVEVAIDVVPRNLTGDY